MPTFDINPSRLGGARRIVRIGGVPKQALRSRLQQAGVRFNESAERLFADDRFVTSSDDALLEVCEVSAGELGLCDGATFTAIVERAASNGLAMCPLELGPHLRLQLTDQPEGFIDKSPTTHCAPPGSLTVASAPLVDDDETLKGFYVRRIDGVLWLRGFRASPDHVYSADDVFVFCHSNETAEQSPALVPAAGPVSHGESSPPAQ